MRRLGTLILTLAGFGLMVWPAYGQEGLVSQLAGLPALSSATGADGTTEYSLSLQILAMMTALTVLPSLVLGMTSFTRIIIVLSI